jgi:glycosyltransferase involved in cell wall biosynthesis
MKVVAVGQHLEGVACIREAQRRGLADRVYIPGSREEIPSLLAELDVFVLPQREDRLPLSLIEALFASRPCVVSATPILQEVLRHEESALLVPPEKPALLANAIDRVLSDDDLRLQLAAGGRALVEESFQATAMGRAYGELYDTLVNT